MVWNVGNAWSYCKYADVSACVAQAQVSFCKRADPGGVVANGEA